MAHFEVEHLRENELAEAWPLLHAAAVDNVWPWWENEAAALLRRGGGVLVARAGNRAIHGLATYEPVKRPLAGRVLAVDKLITFELSRKLPARHALGKALDLLAIALGCRAVAMPLPVRELGECIGGLRASA